MNEPPCHPSFPPKRGLSEEEQRKVRAYIRKHGVTLCPPMGSPDLAALGRAEGRRWADRLSDYMKSKLGMTRKRPERTELEKKKHRRERESEWHRKKKEKQP